MLAAGMEHVSYAAGSLLPKEDDNNTLANYFAQQENIGAFITVGSLSAYAFTNRIARELRTHRVFLKVKSERNNTHSPHSIKTSRFKTCHANTSLHFVRKIEELERNVVHFDVPFLSRNNGILVHNRKRENPQAFTSAFNAAWGIESTEHSLTQTRTAGNNWSGITRRIQTLKPNTRFNAGPFILLFKINLVTVAQSCKRMLGKPTPYTINTHESFSAFKTAESFRYAEKGRSTRPLSQNQHGSFVHNSEHSNTQTPAPAFNIAWGIGSTEHNSKTTRTAEITGSELLGESKR